jgi:hypothetical protein
MNNPFFYVDFIKIIMLILNKIILDVLNEWIYNWKEWMDDR